MSLIQIIPIADICEVRAGKISTAIDSAEDAMVNNLHDLSRMHVSVFFFCLLVGVDNSCCGYDS